jgi:hypothetical protein
VAEPPKVVTGDKPIDPEPEKEERVRRTTFPPAEQPPVVVRGTVGPSAAETA